MTTPAKPTVRGRSLKDKIDAAEVAINEALTAARRTRNSALVKALTEARESLRSAKHHTKSTATSTTTTKASTRAKPEQKKRQPKIDVKPRPTVYSARPGDDASVGRQP
ncbi:MULTISPECIES: hypothetical protein [unclassified Amycolatopsis]|uniref:hypothetical protein n=1 Tax=unclassified Amycolatopsis TaxID=2618356 RepID=UPI002876CA6F|nr:MULTISPECIES: hypothetical protein [unclassified Amycolatopsis]MDS0134549.1 hypothetical protein [Amycolatopsis sp. 505]MDS0147897.1 hypothetical protein [Amycolatopsis sp. CM201R]